MKMNLFTSGNDGYHSYRIPSLIITKSGTETPYDYLVFERFRF